MSWVLFIASILAGAFAAQWGIKQRKMRKRLEIKYAPIVDVEDYVKSAKSDLDAEVSTVISDLDAEVSSVRSDLDAEVTSVK